MFITMWPSRKPTIASLAGLEIQEVNKLFKFLVTIRSKSNRK